MNNLAHGDAGAYAHLHEVSSTNVGPPQSDVVSLRNLIR
jgi:hypothetical protein